MNYEFRKKPVGIEAFQMTRERRNDNSEWPQWLHEAWNKIPRHVGSIWPHEFKGRLAIGTLEGRHIISWDDWIIRGVKGELYSCKPDIFEATYEEVME